LLPRIGDLRHTMRLERHKLRVVEAEARINALSSHIDRLKALNSQDRQVQESIRDAASKMRELQAVQANVPVRQ
jgi:uncharacterized small protein (DUF1192 family)